jgi:DNA mismatch endonuclease (patch repair protein)
MTAIMRGNRSTDTKPEVALRSMLHRHGLRFRKNYTLRLPERRVRVDIAFPRLKLAVFVDGCFWHGCPDHGHHPQRNEEYWSRKLRRNAERDREVNAALKQAGWRIVRVWEHVPTQEAVQTVRQALSSKCRCGTS